MSITSADAIRQMAYKEITISGFDEGEQITVKAKSLSMLGLVESGKVPNHLLGTAVELFEGKSSNNNTSNEKLKEMAGLIGIICENALVEPTWGEIGDILTDKQKMEIYHYTQGGVRALDSFRAQPTFK